MLAHQSCRMCSAITSYRLQLAKNNPINDKLYNILFKPFQTFFQLIRDSQGAGDPNHEVSDRPHPVPPALF